MKWNHLTYLFFILIILTVSCRSTQKTDKAAEKAIVFGRGGGFTGQVIEFVLDEYGTLMMNDKLKSEITVLPSLKQSQSKKIFKQLQTMRFDTINFNHPGNMYFFIRYKSSGKTQEVVWGDPNFPPPTAIKEFYEMLNSKTE